MTESVIGNIFFNLILIVWFKNTSNYLAIELKESEGICEVRNQTKHAKYSQHMVFFPTV